jgi:hypothetical protein
MKAKTVDEAALTKVKITKADFEAALKRIQPATRPEDGYRSLSSKFTRDLEVS